MYCRIERRVSVIIRIDCVVVRITSLTEGPGSSRSAGTAEDIESLQLFWYLDRGCFRFEVIAKQMKTNLT